MAGVADESSGVRRQQCIDVLCGYLRLPYSPELGSSHQSNLVVIEPRAGNVQRWRSRGSPLGQRERHLEYRQNDKEVRVTIVRVIADHLRDHEYSWRKCDFDFRTAHLEDVDLSRAVFGGAAMFDKAMFSGDAWFNEATFSGAAMFGEATFSGGAWLSGVTFSGTAWFGGVTFSGNADFGGVTFSGAAMFNKATFSGAAWFDEATFSGDAARFAGTDFGSGAISFENPRQWGPPPPTFDWDGDLSKKPENVAPQNWPPKPIA
jgi:Pentapeptide repeats (9 copies)